MYKAVEVGMQSFSMQNQHLVMCIDNVSKLSVLQRHDEACYCSS